MTRYKVLRRLGFDPVAAMWVSFLNFVMGAPEGVVGFMNVVIEFDPNK